MPRLRKVPPVTRERIRPSRPLSCRPVCWLVFLAVAFAGFANAAVADPVVPAEAARQAQDIAASLMSPFCPGLTLAACPSSGAAALQDELRRRLQQGETEAALVADFVERFGSRVTGVPARHGLAALAWILPPAGGGAILLLVRLLANRRSSANQNGAAPVDAAMSARVDEELLLLDR